MGATLQPFTTAHLRKMIFSQISTERDRQEQLRRVGKHPFTCASAKPSNGDKVMIIGEEFGEVSKAAYELAHCPPTLGSNAAQVMHLRCELVQLAATAVAWIESIDNERSK